MLRGSVIVYHSSRTEVAEIVTDLSHADSAEGHGLTTSSSWRRSCILLCCYLLLLVLLYRPTIVAMVSLWRTSTFAHGFLVIPISAYLVWTRRKSLALLKPIPTFYALPFLALFALAWLLGQLTATGVLQQFCLVAMTIVSIWGVLGTVVARALLLPLVFLMFAVPLGEGLIPKLQDFSAWFAVKMLDFSRVPVLLEGRFISVPSGRWEVAEACSGIRYLTSSIAIGFLYAGLMYRSWIRRIGFLLASAVVPILANGLRVYGIILLAYLSGNRIAAGVDHLLYGWLFFTIVMILLLRVGFWWREKPQGEVDSLSVSRPNSRDLTHYHPEGEGLRTSGKRTALFSTLFFLMIGLTPLSVSLFWSRPAGIQPLNLAAPLASLPWRINSDDVYGWKPSFSASNAELIQSYKSQQQAVKLYLAYYAPGRQDAKLVSSTNSLFDRKFWWRMGEGEAAVTLEGQSFYVHETFIRSAQQSLVVWNWYWVDGKFTNNEYIAKYLLARARFLRRNQGAAAVALATEDPPDRQQAAEVLKEFLNHIRLQESLRLSGN
jgi:exosortase A